MMDIDSGWFCYKADTNQHRTASYCELLNNRSHHIRFHLAYIHSEPLYSTNQWEHSWPKPLDQNWEIEFSKALFPLVGSVKLRNCKIISLIKVELVNYHYPLYYVQRKTELQYWKNARWWNNTWWILIQIDSFTEGIPNNMKPLVAADRWIIELIILRVSTS